MRMILVLMNVVLLQSCGFEIVDVGNKGVKVTTGEVQPGVLNEGLHWYNPITSDIVEVEVFEQKWADKAQSFSKDGQNVIVDFSLNYNLDKTKVDLIYGDVGRDWFEKIVPQVVFAKTKAILGHYEAMDIIANRLKVTEEIKQAIYNDLIAKNVYVKSFEMTNLDFNDGFEHAIEAKVVAIQEAEKAKNQTVQFLEEKKQKIIQAEGEAESMRIRSQALSQNQNLVNYEAVQKWDGKLPQYMMGSSVPFVNLK